MLTTLLYLMNLRATRFSMKIIALLVALLLSFAPTLRAQSLPADLAGVQRTIEQLYAAFSTQDEDRYRKLVTKDYLLIEQGGILDLKLDIATFASARAAKQTRTDSFKFRSIRIEGTSAVAIYTLNSEIRANGEVTHRTWVESVTLRRSDDGWKVSLLHSTRVESQK